MKTLIIGKGEIGKSLQRIFSKHYETNIIDKNEVSSMKPEIMHIAFPYSNKFIDFVKDYKKIYSPKFIVIHSTVPSGTSRQLDAVHSPVIGLHPFLEKSIKTFTKYLSGSKASEVAQYFKRADINVYLTDKQETTELIKQLSTTMYGVLIEYTKEVKRLCDEAGVPFEFWTIWTDNYNKGYRELGHPEYIRPNLLPIMTKVGGHCVLPNCEFIDSDFTKLIKKRNEEKE